MSIGFFKALTGQIRTVTALVEEPEELGTSTGENSDTQPGIPEWENEGGRVPPEGKFRSH